MTGTLLLSKSTVANLSESRFHPMLLAGASSMLRAADEALPRVRGIHTRGHPENGIDLGIDS